MVHKHHIEEVAGGRERTLSEKLPDNFEVKTQTQTKRAPIITPGVHLTGAMEIHRLTVENKLMGREAELTVDLINATCTTDGWTNYKEVIQSPRSLSLHPPRQRHCGSPATRSPGSRRCCCWARAPTPTCPPYGAAMDRWLLHSSGRLTRDPWRQSESCWSGEHAKTQVGRTFVTIHWSYQPDLIIKCKLARMIFSLSCAQVLSKWC